MIPALIFERQEFYVMLLFAAGALVAYFSTNRRRGEVRTFLYGGELLEHYSDRDNDSPSVVFEVEEDGRTLHLTRKGLEGVDLTTGAFSIAVDISGTDVTIKERITPGRPTDKDAYAGTVKIDCLGSERYHFVYISETIGRNCAFGFTIRPGARVERPLT